MARLDPAHPTSEAALLVTHSSDEITMKAKDGRLITATEITPYIRLSFEKQTVYLKNGHVYTAGAERVDPIPTWVIAEARKLTPEALKSVKFVLPEEKGSP